MRLPLTICVIGLGAFACTSTTGTSSSIETAANSVAETTAENQVIAASEGESAEQNAEDKNRRICKRQIVTGSRFARTRCATAFEWETLERASRDDLSASQRTSTFGEIPQD